MIHFLRTVLYWCCMAIAWMSGIAALTITVAIATNKLPDPQAWMAAVFFTAAGWLKDDLTFLKSGGATLHTPQSRLAVRPATTEEAIVFGHAAKLAQSSEDLVLAYLVELDCGE
jgi:hypothetical protein